MPLLSTKSPVRRSLVLAGGGVRLAYHAGVLQALEETSLSFNHVDGTSGGIFGTAMLASGIEPAEAAARWRRLKLRGFMGVVPLRDFKPGKLGNGGEGIRKAIFPALGIDAARIRANTLFDATFNVCNFSKKTVESIPQERVTEDHLIAGMSLPVFMPAINIGGDWYTDAVWIKDANLLEAVRRGAEEIWLVWGIGNTPRYHKGYFNEYVHMIEISANAGLFWELEELKRINGERENAGMPPVALHIIRPEYPLPLDPDFFFKKIDADTLIAMGYADAKSCPGRPAPFNFSDIPSATAMAEADSTLHFRQQFSGIALWAGKPQRIAIRLGCFVRHAGGAYVLQCFSTLEVAGTARCGFGNELTKTGSGALRASFNVQTAGGIVRISIRMQLTGALDFLLGLDIQTAAISITSGEREAHYTFRQPAAARLRNAMHLAMIGAAKPLERWRQKRQALQYLLQ